MAKSDDSPLTVIDWILDKSGVNLKNYDDFNEDIISIAKKETAKGSPQLEAYINSSKSDVLNDVSTKSGRTVKGEIDKVNDEWRDKVIGEILQAKDESDLDTIQDRESFKNYNDDWSMEVQTTLIGMKNTLEKSGISKKRVAELEDLIGKAKTQEDIDKLFTRGELRRKFGSEEAQKIIDLSEEKAGDLKTLSDEAFDDALGEVTTAETTDDLYTISGRLTEIPNLTTEGRKKLAVEIRKRINELGG